MSAADLLVELGTEELPPKALKTLSERFASELETRLSSAGLSFATVVRYATPRRLAVCVQKLADRQPDQVIERRGPAVSAAFGADGKPTQAALGFARSCNVAFDALERLQTDKGEWLVFRGQQAGKATRELLPKMIDESLAALPIPKRMRWGACVDEFVRPVHWLIILHGEEVIPATILGAASGNVTRGHRFMSAGEIRLTRADEYASRLERDGRVIADFAARRTRVQQLVERAAVEHQGRAIVNDALLDEVTALVEWPAPIVGSFDPHFLEVPREALIATMQGNQKYFPIETTAGVLTNRFITIANIESPQPNLIRDGNERVVRPRLSDAAFFFGKDRKSSLASRAAHLEHIVFERRLGTLAQKTARVMRLAAWLAPHFGADPALATRASALSRCDLVTEMVGEFPELQGTMGRYYAAHDGEPAEVAQALGEFYQPRFAGDAIPQSAVGRAVASAERLDTLLGIFSVGGAPTGDKDPYALRRAALGVWRILVESACAGDLRGALDCGAMGYEPAVTAQVEPVLQFILERSRGYFAEAGFSGEVIESVLGTASSAPYDVARRIAAVAAFLKLPEALPLAAVNKRIANILKKAPPSEFFDAKHLVEPAELALAAQVTQIERDAEPLLAEREYVGYLTLLAGLHGPANRFFDEVLVMADDPALRAARLGLLQTIHRAFLRVADVARISV